MHVLFHKLDLKFIRQIKQSNSISLIFPRIPKANLSVSSAKNLDFRFPVAQEADLKADHLPHPFHGIGKTTDHMLEPLDLLVNDDSTNREEQLIFICDVIILVFVFSHKRFFGSSLH